MSGAKESEVKARKLLLTVRLKTYTLVKPEQGTYPAEIQDHLQHFFMTPSEDGIAVPRTLGHMSAVVKTYLGAVEVVFVVGGIFMGRPRLVAPQIPSLFPARREDGLDLPGPRELVVQVRRWGWPVPGSLLGVVVQVVRPAGSCIPAHFPAPREIHWGGAALTPGVHPNAGKGGGEISFSRVSCSRARELCLQQRAVQ